jgi:hypothetical protein
MIYICKLPINARKQADAFRKDLRVSVIHFFLPSHPKKRALP